MHQLKGAIKNKTVIVYTGHRDIPLLQQAAVNGKLSKRLTDVIQKITGEYVLMMAMSNGTERFLTEEAMHKNIPLVLLTINQEEDDKVAEIKDKHPKKNITGIAVTPDKEQTLPDALTDHLTQYTDILIAVWDGLYDTTANSTAAVVHRFTHCTYRSFTKKQKTVYLHQLPAGHSANPFPVGRYSDDIHTDLPQTVPLQWIATAVLKKSKIWDKGLGKKMKHFFTKEISNSGAILLQYILPIALAFSVLCFGMYGYLHRCEQDGEPLTWLNAFFYAGNLITLNTSVFKFEAGVSLNTARILGGALAAYAFLLAFTLALGYENFRRFRFFFTRRRVFRRKYSVIIGLNELSLYIAQNLRPRRRVIMLYNDAESAYLQRCKDLGAWMIKGYAASASALRKIHFETSEQVYVTSDSEEDNFRCIQEMDQLVNSKTVNPNEAEWYVHLPGSQPRNILQEIIRTSNRTVLTSFYIPENTAERLLIKFPLHRFGQQAQAKMRAVIFGFTDIARQLLMVMLQQGVYLDNKELHIHIYCIDDEQKEVARFIKNYPFLFSAGEENNPADNILQRITGNRVTIAFTFFEPGTDQLPDEALLTDWLSHDATLSFYVCLGSGITNASFLYLFLPRLNYLLSQHRNCDTGVFWFYNFSDTDEEEYLQKKLAALAPHLLIESFGNYLSETTLEAINNQTMNHMARQIALWYYLAYDYKESNVRNMPALDFTIAQVLEQEGYLAEYDALCALKTTAYKESFDKRIIVQKHIWHRAVSHSATGEKLRTAMNDCWKTLSETDREGNRQAANHIWVKLLEANIGWELRDDDNEVSFDELNIFWPEDVKESLAVLEHRRWNTMKLLEGWRPFTGTEKEWKQHKELLKQQRVHNLMISYADLPESERDKDHHQIEGIPFFLLFYFRQQAGKRMVLMNSL